MFHMDCFLSQFIEQLKYVLRVKTVRKPEVTQYYDKWCSCIGKKIELKLPYSQKKLTPYL